MTYTAVGLALLVLAAIAWQGKDALLERYYQARLEHEDVGVRLTAVRRLGELGSLRSAEPLARLAVRVIADLGPERGSILHSTYPRQDAPPLAELVTSTSDALARLGSGAVPALVHVGRELHARTVVTTGTEQQEAQSTSGAYSNWLAQVVVTMCPTDATGVVALLRHPDAAVRTDLASLLRSAVDALRHHQAVMAGLATDWHAPAPAPLILEPAREVVPELLAALDSPDSTVRQATALLLGHLGPEAGAATLPLLEALKTGGMKGTAIAGLGGIGAPAAPAVLASARNSPDGQFRQACAQALSRMGSDALPRLVEALHSEARTERHCAAEAFTAMQQLPDGVASKLAARFKEFPVRVCWLLSAPLIRAQERSADAVPHLVRLLADTSELKHVAAHTLGALGTTARDAIAPLEEMAKSADETDRRYANWALEDIRVAGLRPKVNLPR